VGRGDFASLACIHQGAAPITCCQHCCYSSAAAAAAAVAAAAAAADDDDDDEVDSYYDLLGNARRPRV